MPSPGPETLTTGHRATGPRTPGGKARSAQNARTHGLLSQAVVLPDEDGQVFDVFRQTLVDQLAPVGELETVLADRIVACTWRLRRVLVFEAGVFEVERPSETERLLARSLGEAEPTSPTVTLGIAFIRAAKNSADPLTKLSRYETTLERSFYRGLHELQRLQAVRAGRDISVPAVVDVDVCVGTSTE
jgi:hypothetical protein